LSKLADDREEPLWWRRQIEQTISGNVVFTVELNDQFCKMLVKARIVEIAALMIEPLQQPVQVSIVNLALRSSQTGCKVVPEDFRVHIVSRYPDHDEVLRQEVRMTKIVKSWNEQALGEVS